ncbi:MAG TPA: hypothetical protein DCP92_16595 [Nitrospiraceae bacterium]|jgi:hypothetical protein|nr:hypothetical protein [Nitrospiraceae bacterium]
MAFHESHSPIKPPEGGYKTKAKYAPKGMNRFAYKDPDHFQKVPTKKKKLKKQKAEKQVKSGDYVPYEM